jgi:hypothetical protein
MSESPAPEAAEPEPTAAGPEVPDETASFRWIRQPGAMIVLLVVALAGISLTVYFVSSGSPKGQSAANLGTTKPGAGKADTGATPGPMPSAPMAHQVGSTASVPTPKPLKPSNPAQVESWNAGKVGAVLVQVTEDSGSVLMAYGSKEYPETLQACVALAGAVRKAEALPPIPDTAMQKLYVESLNAFTTGITECEAAITQHPEGVEDVVTDVDHPEISQALSRFDIGVKDLYLATGALRKQ